MIKIRNFLPLFFLILLIIFVSIIIFKLSKRENSSQLANEFGTKKIIEKISLPDFSLPNLLDDRKIFVLKNLQNEEGKFYVVNFFAYWCSSCIKEHEILFSLKDLNLAGVYGVAWQDFEDNAKLFLDKNGNPFDLVAIDSQGLFSRIANVDGAPETFVINNYGEVVLRYKGVLSYQNINEIKQIINEKK